MHDFNARKPAKNFGTRLFKDDVCSYNKYPRDSVRKTASVADFIAREIQSPNALVSSALFCGLFLLHKIRAQKKNTLNSSWYVSLVAYPSRGSLSLNFCSFETSERISFARESREKEVNARSRIHTFCFSLFLSSRRDLRRVRRELSHT